MNGNKGFLHAEGPRLCSWLAVGQVFFKGVIDLEKKNATVGQLKLFAKFIVFLVNSFDN